LKKKKSLKIDVTDKNCSDFTVVRTSQSLQTFVNPLNQIIQIQALSHYYRKASNL